MFGFNQEQVAAFLRTCMQVLGGVVATQAWYSNELWLSVTGVVVTLGVTAWGMWARSDKNLVASAANVGAVTEVVVTDPKLKTAGDPTVVVSSGGVTSGLR